MDDRGFIFTTDATLALVVVIVLTTAIVSYQMVPAYMGQDHQHLEALADSVLAVMEQDGTLNNAAVEAARNNTTGAQEILNNRLSVLIPSDTAYRLNLQSSNVVTATDDKGLSYSRDSVTKVKVISGPAEGWMGRAWYKVENFTFIENPQNVTTTLWNFHNWISNFSPWSGGNYIQSYPYWGSGTSPQNIVFSVPDATLHNAKFIVGAASSNRGKSFSGDLNINSNIVRFNMSNSTFVGPRSNDVTQWMWNSWGNIPVGNFIVNSNNGFYAYFRNMTNNRYNMPWFSIIANYETNFPVPEGIISRNYYFEDKAGLAVHNPTNLTGGNSTREYGLQYDLNNGIITPTMNLRSVRWNNFYNNNARDGNDVPFDNGVPFEITNANDANRDVTATKTAVSVTKDVDIPRRNTVLDSFVVINAYGAVDGALVEVWNGTHWRTAFCSFNLPGQTYTGVSTGYGNTPGIIFIPRGYLLPGQDNKVRITVWDDVPGGDYDLVGLTNCYVSATYSALNVQWDNTPFRSYQSTTYTQTQTETFSINADAQKVYLFVGTGQDSRNIQVDLNGTNLYNGPIPYYLDLAALDAALPSNRHQITTANSTAAKYYLKNVNNIPLRITVTSASRGWESGDSNAEIFSGTRVSVIYPESLRNIWNIEYASTAQAAEAKAKQGLIEALNNPAIADSIKTEALYTGDMPNQIPVRLDLWKQ